MPELGIDNYRYGPDVVLSDLDRKKVRDAFSAILAEMDDASDTGEMFAEYAWVVKFILRNRKVARQNA